MPKRAVYTALMGDYETLNDAQASSDAVDFICFTDDSSLKSDRWELVVVPPEFRFDPHRSQRKIKITGHSSLSGYDETLYIDNAVSLLRDSNDIFDLLLSGQANLGFARHSFRSVVAEEFAAVVAAGIDDHYRVTEQWDHYNLSDSLTLVAPVLWGGMTARRRSPEVTAFNETWYHHVLRYSRRDQLSLQAALAQHDLHVNVVDLDNHTSEYHRWPVAGGRRAHMRSATATLRTPEGVQSLIDLDAVRTELARAIAELEEAQAVIAKRTQDNHDLEAKLSAIRSSTSWKITAPLRRLSNLARYSRHE